MDLPVPYADRVRNTASRRHVLKGMGAVASLASVGLPAASLIPKVFDPVAYIADHRAIGIDVCLNGLDSYALCPEKRFGENFTAVAEKWWPSRRADPNHIQRVHDALMAERV